MNPLPIVGWLPKYKRRYLRGDLIAGVSSWALVVPQSVAYGQIAGMPAQAGLAAAVTGPLGYGVLGTSRQLIVSPTSSSALISATVVGEADTLAEIRAELAHLGIDLWLGGAHA